LVLTFDAGSRKSYPGSGTVWRDLLGSTISASLVSGSTFNSSNLGNIAFDGIDDQVIIANSSSFNNTTSKTVELWIRAGNINGTFNAIMTNRNNSDSLTNFAFYLDDRQVVRTWNSSGTDQMVLIYATSNGTTPYFTWSKESLGITNGDNAWHQIVGITDIAQSRIELYYDGQFKHSTSIAGTISTPDTSLRIGSGYDVGTTQFPFAGNIASIKIYNRVLSALEILQNYNALRSRFNT